MILTIGWLLVCGVCTYIGYHLGRRDLCEKVIPLVEQLIAEAENIERKRSEVPIEQILSRWIEVDTERTHGIERDPPWGRVN